jgi:hypothetical protein
MPETPARDWVIRKNGYFYRANRSGYTMEVCAAGRYTEQEARAEARVEPHSISAHPLSEFVTMAETPAREKSLFIPLRAEWYDKIERGEKAAEYRAYGPRWNERTCRVGRLITLSRGYGTGRRLQKAVASFAVLDWINAPLEARTIYPDAAFIAEIGLKEAELPPQKKSGEQNGK